MGVTNGSDYGLPSLDLNFARNKSLNDTVTGRNLVTFTRSSTGTYVGADGLIKTAVIDEPRFDHNPTTGVCNGLLIEESRTNEITNSMPTTSGGGITNTLVNDLPGSFSTGRRLTSSGGNDIRIILGTNTLNVVFTYSFFARAGTQGSYIFLRNGTGPASAWNLNTNTVIKDDFGTAKIENYGNGWWRCYVTITGSGASGFLLGVGDSGLNSVNGDNIIIAGVQLERGSFPTSHIPTSGSTVTRSADVASITGTNFSSFYNQSEGTWYGLIPILSGSSGRLVEVMGPGGSNVSMSIRPRASSSRVDFAREGSASSNISVTFPCKISASYSSSSIQGAANGNLSGLITSGNHSNSTNMDIGRIPSENTYLGGTISRLTYYPKRLPDYQLQALTR